MSDVTSILDRVQGGDPRAAEELLPLVYGELRKLAAAKMANEAAAQPATPNPIQQVDQALVGCPSKSADDLGEKDARLSISVTVRGRTLKIMDKCAFETTIYEGFRDQSRGRLFGAFKRLLDDTYAACARLAIVKLHDCGLGTQQELAETLGRHVN